MVVVGQKLVREMLVRHQEILEGPHAIHYCIVCLLCIMAIGLVRPESSDPQGVMITTAHVPNTSRYPWAP